MRAFDKYEKLGAYHFDWYNDPNWAWYKLCVDRCVDFCKGSTIDVGGGDGFVAKKIFDNGFYTLILDNSRAALDLIDTTDWFWWSKCDLNDPESIEEALEYNKEYYSYEYMVCLNVIEHLKNPDGILKIIRHDITKGAIIITDKPTGNLGRYHEHEYTKEELLDTFKEFKPKYFEIHSTEHGKPITFHGVEITK